MARPRRAVHRQKKEAGRGPPELDPVQRFPRTYLLRETMAGISEKLKPYGFMRIHRSVLVNRAFVSTIQCGSGGNYLLQTSSGKE